VQAYEFKLEPSSRGGLMIPFEVQQLLLRLKKARAILLVEDEEKSAEWNRSAGVLFTAFFKCIFRENDFILRV